MNSAEDYDGGRTAGDIVKWAEDKLTESAEPPQVIEVCSLLLSLSVIVYCTDGTSRYEVV